MRSVVSTLLRDFIEKAEAGDLHVVSVTRDDEAGVLQLKYSPLLLTEPPPSLSAHDVPKCAAGTVGCKGTDRELIVADPLTSRRICRECGTNEHPPEV